MSTRRPPTAIDGRRGSGGGRERHAEHSSGTTRAGGAAAGIRGAPSLRQPLRAPCGVGAPRAGVAQEVRGAGVASGANLQVTGGPPTVARWTTISAKAMQARMASQQTSRRTGKEPAKDFRNRTRIGRPAVRPMVCPRAALEPVAREPRERPRGRAPLPRDKPGSRRRTQCRCDHPPRHSKLLESLVLAPMDAAKRNCTAASIARRPSARESERRRPCAGRGRQLARRP